ncbi:MAG: phenylacetate--CoA ligase family protein [Gammaproteobacteria bacterium]|nr:phenylacetate--CoA ligase family protein [Gammaproteobacteria bacterium]
MTSPPRHEPILVDVASGLPGVDWPAVPSPEAAAVLSVLFQLDQSQWWPREALEAQQLRQLSALLDHARATVPFYRERPVGSDPLPPKREVTWEDWRRLPVLTRADLQAHFEQLKSTAVPPGHGRHWLARSSGSTGRPVSVLKTDLVRRLWRTFTLRDHLWQGRDLRGRLAAIRYVASGAGKPPEGSVSPSWDALLGEVVRTGPGHLLQVQADLREQAAWLRRIAPDYLVTYPSNLVALLRHFRDEGLGRPPLRDVTTLAETLPEEARALCREVWGVEVRDIYSTVECGYLALQCPEHEHYHVQAEGVVLEVVDDHGRPCGPGEVGRVLATPLHNFATPLLRYEVGDYAEVGDSPCPCGRGLPVIRRVMGRARNLLRLPDGRRVWPSTGILAIAEAAPVRQAQVVQDTPDHVELRYVSDRELTGDEEGAVRRTLLDRLGDSFRLDLTRVDAIPRGPGGKYEDFLSLVV